MRQACPKCGRVFHAGKECPKDKPPHPPKRRKASYIGAPACFELELAMRHIMDAFGQDDAFGCYVVGSALDRPDRRDIDVVMIMSDEGFAKLFPDAQGSSFEFDTRWLVMTVALSKWLSDLVGLPIDFKFQPQTLANQIHKGRRNAIGFRIAKS